MAWILQGSLTTGDHKNSNKFPVSVTTGGQTVVNVLKKIAFSLKKKKVMIISNIILV